jgi:hypothetical protein
VGQVHVRKLTSVGVAPPPPFSAARGMGRADIALRHIARSRPDDLARALIPAGSVQVVGWVDTQLTMMIDEEEDDAENEAMRRIPGLGEMIIKAEKKASEAMVAKLLGRIFARRVGRLPTRGEKRKLVRRAEALGPVPVEDALLDLERDALVRWLADPPSRTAVAKPRRRAAPAPTP